MTNAALITRIIITVCFMALLIALSIVPGRPRPGDSLFARLVAKTPRLVQKTMHVFLYGVLTLLLAWTFDASLDTSSNLLFAITVAVGFGTTLEWYQTKVPGRYGTLFDASLNAAGAVLGVLAAMALL